MKKIVLSLLALFCLTSGVYAFGDPPIRVDYENGIYHIILKGDKIKKRIKFVSSEHLVTAREMHQMARPRLTVNAGFFDPKNEKTISYIVTDRQTADDPLFNENLMRDPVLRQNIDKIINRTEFRVMQCDDDNSWRYEITPHKSSVDFACHIENSAQGGPLVYPDLKLEEEFFVQKKDSKVVRESASVLHKTSRTIIGLKNGEAHILIITDENPMDLYEVHELCKEMGFDRAMAFDGGSSTSMNYKNKIEVTSRGDGGGRSVKSFMLVY